MFGERLKLARKKAGLSLRGLSTAMEGEVTAQAIGKYERGEMMPSSGVLHRLTKVLSVSLEFLISDQVVALEAVEFRKLSGTSVKDKARVEAAVIDHLQRYIAVEEILGLGTAEVRVPESKNRFVGIEDDAEVLANDIRRVWELGIDPIPNMTSLLEDKGIKVLLMSLPGQVSGLTALVKGSDCKDKGAVIVVNRDVSLERRRLTLAHELAHRLMDAAPGIDQEKASNVFAGAFLAPRDHLVREIGKHRKALGYAELVQLKRMYRMSAAALLVRLKQIGVIDQSTLAYAFQTYARAWRKSEPDPLEASEEKGQHEVPKRFERLCYWALAEELISPGKASELLRQPLSTIQQGMKGPSGADADHRK